MKTIEEILKNTTEENAEKTDWTKAWSGKYPILGRYQKEVDVARFSKEIRNLLDSLQAEYGYNELDAMLVLKDILAHVYFDKKK